MSGGQTGLYELHITSTTEHEAAATAVARCLHWKTSRIDGDPVGGPGVRLYLTRYADSESNARRALADCVALLKAEGVQVQREKIELIVHDFWHR